MAVPEFDKSSKKFFLLPRHHHAEGVKLNSRGQRPRIERQEMSATLKGSNINPTLTGSMIYMDDFRWRCLRLLNPSPAG
jgi:hypothetical protein